MAQLKDSLITGDLRVTGTIYGDVPLNDLTGADDLKAIEALTGTSGTLTKTAANTWALSSGVTPASHTHGNIQNGGTLQSSDITIANGDKIVVTDSSDSNKVARTSISFDGSTATKALTQKGTWETFNNYSHPTGNGNNHIPSNGSTGQFLKYSSAGTATWASLTKSDITDFPTSITPTSHAHGKITNAGAIANADNVTIANNDRLVISDSSDSYILKNTSIVFDGSTTTKALTQKGTWETFNNYSHPTGDGNLHVPATGTSNNGKVLKAGSTAGSISWGTLSKSDVGLGNVANTTITVTSSSVSDGTNTFNRYTHPTGDGNLHVPATGTSNNGKVLKAGSTAGSLSWGTLSKSDVGLGNVANTTITVTSSSVSDGTNTFNKYTHPTTTAVTAAAVKVGKDSTGHVVIGNALTAADVGAATSGHNHDSDYVNVTGDTMTGTLNGTNINLTGQMSASGGATAGDSSVTDDIYSDCVSNSGAIQLFCGGSAGEWKSNKKGIQVYNGSAYKEIVAVDMSNNATFVGSLSGNASTATHATTATQAAQDQNGDIIHTTYLKPYPVNLSIEGPDDDFVFDKTFDEIVAAYENGRYVYLIDDTFWFVNTTHISPLISLGASGGNDWDQAYFESFTSNGYVSYILNDDDTVQGAIQTFSATDTKNTTGSTNSTSKLFLVGATSQASSPTTYSNSNVYIASGTSGSTDGYLYARRVYNAVWNDYAEYRTYNDGETPYGKVVCENGNDTVSLSKKRLQPGAMICSDTFGHCMGQEENAIPIAVAGRVLAYTAEPRETYNFFIGQAVCAGPNGTVSIMTKDEVKEYPECVVGYVSAVPEYEEWGTNNTKVDGRVWIKVK